MIKTCMLTIVCFLIAFSIHSQEYISNADYGVPPNGTYKSLGTYRTIIDGEIRNGNIEKEIVISLRNGFVIINNESPISTLLRPYGGYVWKSNNSYSYNDGFVYLKKQNVYMYHVFLENQKMWIKYDFYLVEDGPEKN